MISSVLSVALILAIGVQEPFHARRLGDKASPPATIAAAAWLEGHWLGDGLGGVSEEVWSPPRGGVMMGMYRSLKQDKASFYEFLMLVEENGTLVMKLKHFNPDFSGWDWSPYTGPRSTTLTNSLPYSAVPSTASGSSGRGANELAW